MKKKISIIIPCYNEEKTIDKIMLKIFKTKIKQKKEIIVVDDFSTDQSYFKLKKLSRKYKFKLRKHKKNYGKGAAIHTASKYVTGNIVLIQDADLEYDPEDYKKIIKPILKGKFKVVYGSRTLNKHNKKRNNSFSKKFRVFGNFILTAISNFFNNQKLTDAHTCYKAFDSRLFLSLKLKEKDFAFCPEVTTKIGNRNIKIKEVPISYYGRSYKEGKKINFFDAFRAFYVILKYRFL